ncbi:MAG TPA: YicC/YloC family endoribonuclease [Caulobacteraceae bacterium]|jgi:uncharacterized protein (TIGR00255 family)
MSLSGMTGFARRDGAQGAWTWTTEVRSVNGRALDVRFRAPAGFESLERLARAAAQARFQRGQVGITVQARRAESMGAARIHLDVIERYLEAISPLIESGRATAPTADGLLALRGVSDSADADDDPDARALLEAALLNDIVGALDDLAKARVREGRALGDLIEGFLARIDAMTIRAETAASTQPQLVRDRFARRLVELLGEAAPQDRILQEAAAQAARADVREELDRIRAHLIAAREIIDSAGPAGRRLDFLAQEFMREANTLTAKSASAELTTAGLELKTVIDQLREQVQNVE